MEKSKKRAVRGKAAVQRTLGFGLAVVCTTGCLGERVPEDAIIIGNRTEPLFVDEAGLWNGTSAFTKVTIPVCWESDTAGLETEKKWAREYVEKSWEAYSNIDFTGWETCPATGTTGGIRVTMRDAIGECPVGTDARDAVGACKLNSWASGLCSSGFTLKQCVGSTAVHEFGHGLGFDHEQARPDTTTEGAGYSYPNGSPCTTPDRNFGGTTEVGDWDSASVMNYCNPTRANAGVLWDGDIAGIQMFYGTKKISQFSFDTGWRTNKHVRLVGDVNGDTCADVVGASNSGVEVALSNCAHLVKPSEYFGVRTPWLAGQFGYNAGGWRVERHPRMLADVNADGKQDFVGFADDGVYVSLSTGTAFKPMAKWVSDYGYATAPRAWDVKNHPRFLIDVNNDKAADVVGFYDDGVYVSVALPNQAGTDYEKFAAPELWIADFGSAYGWSPDRHIRTLADVDRDGDPDIVGFLDDGVYVSTLDGNQFNDSKLWVASYGRDVGGWTMEAHPRMLADVNGDRRADIVGFGATDVFVSLSTGAKFETPKKWLTASFGSSAAGGGWSISKHPRMVVDVNQDGRADIVGFGSKNVQVGMANGAGTAFEKARNLVYGYDSGRGWTVAENPRMLADTNSNGYPEVIGFGNDGVHTTDLEYVIDKKGTTE